MAKRPKRKELLEELERFIRKKGLTKGDLAMILNVSQSFVSQILSGKKHIPPDKAITLAGLGAPPDMIVELVSPKFRWLVRSQLMKEKEMSYEKE